MRHGERPPEPQSKSRRFRFTRRVTTRPTPGQTPPAPSPVEIDDARQGTPEEDRSLREGCTGCIRGVGLFLVIMIASILATCAVRK